ncbi:enoyl-CoA hydratase/isomerase family protein [Magnetospirillum sulfuroxidans]|uniref:3-hydroxyisobutyryl-CoA hydrolase n=1 Tax=Magnetospirillum sulfuroxidans TaxID=611300 RepID=A0ABS5IB58_9PROT|nr:enoyl-CoA hydratase/isomerase family protein [Magnetospirillum sulfuroxidans]
MSEAEILFERQGGLGRIVLNRPKALNALTLDQVHALHPQLEAWAADDAVTVVVIEGAGEKAFCAGGDIRALYDAAKAGQMEHVATFYRDEYRLNRKIKTYGKPYVAMIDGIVMGGGVGVSVHGRYRVAGDRTLFAMPETGIGFFPDVGGAYFLPRCPGQLGMYLGLTGARLKAADCLYAGIATHFVPSARKDEVRAALAEAEDVKAVLDAFHADPGPAPLAARRDLIDRCFAADSYDGVLAALAVEDDAFAADTLAAINGKSPTAGKVAFEQIRRGAALDFDACMAMEFRLSQVYAPAADFIEGIRAVIIDKDGKPVWAEPASTEAVARAFDTVPACGDLSF